jgi:tRNA(fMet)-specific endonuclease VapC
MKRFLLDSGILSDLINRRYGVRTRAQAESRRGSLIGTSIPILAEMVYGIEFGENRDRNMQSLVSVLPTLKLWPFERDSAFEYGRLHAELRRMGRPMGVIDMMTAAIARTLGSTTVVSKDSDLLAVPGLSVENWAI